MNFMKQLGEWRRERARRTLVRKKWLLIAVSLVGGAVAAVVKNLPWDPSSSASATVVERPDDLCRRVNLPDERKIVVAASLESESVIFSMPYEKRGLIYPDAQVPYWTSAKTSVSTDPRDRVHYVQPELQITRFDEERVNGHYEGWLILEVISAAEQVCEAATYSADPHAVQEGYATWNDLRVSDAKLHFHYSARLQSRVRILDGGRTVEIAYSSDRSLRNDLPFLKIVFEAESASTKEEISTVISIGGRLKRLM